MMQREVTSTIVKVAKMEVVEGEPTVSKLADETLVGNVDLEKAQRVMTRKLGSGVTVLSVEPQTEVYELSVEDFLAIAKVKVKKEAPADSPEQN